MKSLRALLSVALILGLAACSDAADAKAKAKKKGTVGQVEKVDSTAKTFTIKTGKKKDPNAVSKTITFNDTTKVSIRNADGTKDGKIGDVASGKRVQIQTETKDGKEIATTVTVVEAKKKK